MNKPACIFAGIGMTLYWPLLRRSALFYILAGHDESSREAVIWYASFLALIGGLVAFGIIAERKTRHSGKRWLHTPSLVLSAGAAYCLCKRIEIFLHPLGALGHIISVLGLLLYAVIMVALTWMWASCCVSMERRRAAIISAVSFALSFACTSVVNELLINWYQIGTLVKGCLPLVSLACWCFLPKPEPALPSRVPPIACYKYPYPLLAIMAVFLISGGIVRGLQYGPLTADVQPTSILRELLTALFSLVVLAYCLIQKDTTRFTQMSWSCAAIMVFAGLLLMVTSDETLASVGGNIVLVGRTCLSLLFWIMLCDLARETTIPLVYGFASIFFSVEILSSFLGYILIPNLLVAFALSTTSAMTLTLLALDLVLIIATIIFFNQTRLVSIQHYKEDIMECLREVQEEDETVRDGQDLGRILSTYGLTDRETDVAKLLAQGNSQRKISEVLQVSIGTTQSHIRAIYRKCSVHSRQEFIDLIRRNQKHTRYLRV